MKRIDLLAKEYADSNSTYLPEILINAYRAGFRRAREMADKACWESSHRHTHSMGRDAYKDASLMIERLGEEECD